MSIYDGSGFRKQYKRKQILVLTGLSSLKCDSSTPVSLFKMVNK